MTTTKQFTKKHLEGMLKVLEVTKQFVVKEQMMMGEVLGTKKLPDNAKEFFESNEEIARRIVTALTSFEDLVRKRL